MCRLFIFVVICVAITANAGWFGGHKSDFEELDKFLASKSGNDEPNSNLAIIRQNLASLQGSTREAAELVLNLADATRCTELVLSHLIKVKEARLTSSKGASRIHAVLQPYLASLVEICTAYVDQAVELRVDGQFSDQVNGLSGIDTGRYLRPLYQARQHHSNFFAADLLYNLTWKLARANPRFQLDNHVNELTGKPTRKGHKTNTARAYDQHLVQPCRQFTSAYSDLFEGAEALANLTDVDSYTTKRSHDFRRKAFTYILCRSIQDRPVDLSGQRGAWE